MKPKTTEYRESLKRVVFIRYTLYLLYNLEAGPMTVLLLNKVDFKLIICYIVMKGMKFFSV